MLKTFASAVAMLALGATMALAADSSYPHASKPPLITGTVVSVSDVQIVVDPGQGQPLTLEIDSRTLAPADLRPGTVIEVEFRLMENGQHYASRIVPIRGGMGPDRKAAYAPGHGDAASRTAPETLPQTASSQPLVALLGLLALGAAGLVLLARRPRRV